MKKTIYIIFIMSILYLSIANALDECKGVVDNNDLPCEVLLPINTSITACNSINVSFFTNATLLDSNFMIQKNPSICAGNFTQTTFGTYLIIYSTGDSGSITIEEDINNTFYLYVVSIIVFFILFGIGFHLEDNVPIILAGMLSIVLAINLFINGFPNLTNDFLKQGIVIVLVGIGFYFVLAPSIEEIESWKGRMEGFD